MQKAACDPVTGGLLLLNLHEYTTGRYLHDLRVFHPTAPLREVAILKPVPASVVTTALESVPRSVEPLPELDLRSVEPLPELDFRQLAVQAAAHLSACLSVDR
jgi:hypothetical protein